MAVGCGLVFALDLISWHFCIGYVGPAYMIALPLAIVGLYMIIGMDMAQLTP